MSGEGDEEIRIFDAHIRSDVRSDDDLRNLSYFETAAALTTAYDARSFDRAADLLEYFDWLVAEEADRLEECGLRPHVALGVLPDARPIRRHPELWRELPERLDQERVSAVGEIGAFRDDAEQWSLFERQLEMSAEAGLPAICTPPDDLRVNMTYKMMMRSEETGLAPERMVMNDLDSRMVETVVRDGFVAGVSVGAFDGDARELAAHLVEVVDSVGHADRIVLNSGLSASRSNVLGVPKTIQLLVKSDMEAGAVQKLAWKNADRLFGGEKRAE